MLTFIVEENCEDREKYIYYTEQLKEKITSIVLSQKLDSLRYFVVADKDTNRYLESVNKYANILNQSVASTDNEIYSCIGKTIEGCSSEGAYSQVIVVRSVLIEGMYISLLIKNGILTEPAQDIVKDGDYSLVSVVHEIGHAVNNANIFHLRHFVDNQVRYSLNNEIEKYIDKLSFNTWGEYFAESFAYATLRTMDIAADDKETELIECVEGYSKGKKIEQIIERVRQILYDFAHCCARVHVQKNKNYDFQRYADHEDMLRYEPFLTRIETDLIGLMDKYPEWNVDICMKELSKRIQELIEYEIEN